MTVVNASSKRNTLPILDTIKQRKKWLQYQYAFLVQLSVVVSFSHVSLQEARVFV